MGRESEKAKARTHPNKVGWVVTEVVAEHGCDLQAERATSACASEQERKQALR